MQLQDKTLVVQRAQMGAKPEGLDDQGLSAPLSIEDLQNPGIGTILNVQINAAAMLGALIAHSPKSTPSPVLQIMNLFSREELCKDDEYLDIVTDIQEEGEKFGRVVSVLVPRPLLGGRLKEEDDMPDSSTDPPGVGRVSF